MSWHTHTATERDCLLAVAACADDTAPTGQDICAYLRERTSHSQAAIYRTLSDLADEGLVAITPDADDQRTQRYQLTAAGYQCVQAHATTVATILAETTPPADDAVPTPGGDQA